MPVETRVLVIGRHEAANGRGAEVLEPLDETREMGQDRRLRVIGELPTKGTGGRPGGEGEETTNAQ